MKDKLQRMHQLADEGVIRRIRSKDPNKSNLVMFKYIYGLSNWNNPDILDARGIVFDENTGEVVVRPYKKFFNENQYSYYRWNKPPEFITTTKDLVSFIGLSEPPMRYDRLIVQDKLDGSMISLSGNIVTSSGSFDSEHTEYFKRFMVKQYGLDFLEDVYRVTSEKNITLVFEYINPDFNPIVVEYPEEKVVLHGVINNLDGSEDESLYDSLWVGSFERPYEYSDVSDIDELMRQLENKDVEGVILKFITKDGVFRLKKKTESYLRKHAINTTLGLSSKLSIKSVFELLINDEFDDVESQLINMTPNKIKNIEIIREEFNYWKSLENLLIENEDWMERYRTTGEEKKKFVMEVKQHVENISDVFILINYNENNNIYEKLLARMVNKAKLKIDKEGSL